MVSRWNSSGIIRTSKGAVVFFFVFFLCLRRFAFNSRAGSKYLDGWIVSHLSLAGSPKHRLLVGFPLNGHKSVLYCQSYGYTYNFNISFMHPTGIASIEMFSASYKHDTHTF